MRSSRVRRKLAAGQAVSITKMDTADPAVCGVIGPDWDPLGNVIRTLAIYEIDTIVLVGNVSSACLIRSLRAAGLGVPRCLTDDGARRIGLHKPALGTEKRGAGWFRRRVRPG